MYNTCLFCNRPLGANQVIEEFPVGRRLAFDGEKGRLWVVCRACERWNLSPLEERWEAVEACERIFRDTRLRVSTENIGLARHGEGLELVRVGRPLRPEFAAWRYGDQFGRRRKRAMAYGAGATALGLGVYFGGAMLTGGVGMGGFWLWQAVDSLIDRRTAARLVTPEGRLVRLGREDLKQVRLRPASGDQGFRLIVKKGRRRHEFEGVDARRAASRVVPRINRRGGSRDSVRAAVAEIEREGHPEKYLAHLVDGDRFRSRMGVPGYINKMPAPTKLALEMALHEEDERRALEGELWLLERAWSDAEEIAAIADRLIEPPGTREFIERNRDPRS